MQPKDRKLLTILAIILIAVWFVGDVLLGAAVADMALGAQRENSGDARAEANRRMTGSYSSFRGTSRKTGPLELASFHETVRRPLRYAAIAGLILLLAFSPIVEWVRKLPQYYSLNSRAVVSVILIVASVSMFAGAQFVVSRNSTTFMQTRPLTGAALEEDRRQRTMVNPPSHLNPNVGSPGRVTSITFGADPTVTVAFSEIDKSVDGYVDIIRLVAAIIGCLGLIYAFLGAQQHPAHAAEQNPASISGN